MPDDFLTEDLALSILFEYDGLSIQMVESTVINQAAPPSDDIGQLDGSPGFWYELRDDQGAVAWRHAAPWPFSFEIELPHDELGENPGTVPDPAPKGAFVGIVPVDAVAHFVALVGTPPPGLPEGALGDLAVFDVGGNQ
jgi:hypothetical protein